MGTTFSFSIGRVTGWAMTAFVVGVAAHSWQPYWHLAFATWIALFVLGAVCVGAVRHPVVRVVIVVAVAFGFGVWRFDVATRPRLLRIGDRQFLSTRAVDQPAYLRPIIRLREMTTARIEQELPHEEAQLVAGMMYGQQALTSDQKTLFRHAGLMHLVAVSGSNVTIIVECMAMIAVVLGLRKRHALVVMTIAILSFIVFAGLGSSVSRAAIMGWCVLFARYIGRVSRSTRLLLVAATVLLLIQPWSLFFDAGFALSFLAMWGLLAWAPLIEERVSWIPKRFALRSSFATSVAATAMTAPYIAWSFEQISFAGIFTNMLALPLVPFVMASGVCVVLWGALPGHHVISMVSFGFTCVIEWIAGLVEYIPWSHRVVRDMQLSTVVICYIVLVYFWFVLSKKKDFSTGKREIF